MDDTKTLRSARAAITYTTYGGTILSLKIYGREVLFLSPFSSHPELPVRGGIPVIWPWFGKDSRGKHGLARSKYFKVVREEATDDGVFLEMKLECEELTCSLLIESSHETQITLKTYAGSGFYGFSAALHAYFAMSGDQPYIEGLPNQYLDALDGMYLKRGEDYFFSLYNGMDRIYTSYPACVSINGLKITPFGCDSLVLWNPGASASEINDLRGHSGFVCIEPALLHHKTLYYGEEISFGFKIQVVDE